jgi:HSP20 family protein
MATLTRREARHLPEVFDRFDPWTEVFGWLPKVVAPTIRVEEYTKDGRFVVRAELPGIDPDKDITVEVADGTLTIRAERREEIHDGGRSEFHYGSFVRHLALPAGTAETEVSAKYTDGILQVTFPVPTRSAEARKVAVERR